MSLFDSSIDDETPLFLAVRNNDLGAVRLLVKAGNVGIDAKNLIGQTVFHVAVGKHTGIMKLLLGIERSNNNLLDAQDDLGDTPLHLAVKHGYTTEHASMLIRNGSQALLIKNNRGRTPFHEAAKQFEGLRFLLHVAVTTGMNPKDFDFPDADGKTPFDIAFEYSRYSTAAQQLAVCTNNESYLRKVFEWEQEEEREKSIQTIRMNIPNCVLERYCCCKPEIPKKEKVKIETYGSTINIDMDTCQHYCVLNN